MRGDLSQVISQIEADGWKWLLRSDNERGYYAHVYDKRFSVFNQNVPHADSYHIDEVEAMIDAWERAQIERGKRSVM